MYGAPEFTTSFGGVNVALSLVLCVVFYVLLFSIRLSRATADVTDFKIRMKEVFTVLHSFLFILETMFVFS